ncbi:YwmB family TATA-box binding protein [Aquibacillus koreensis]|uniref:YwmB family TATA-box binding protein n=1 Tax=Aquibacillus koreensis TaxID=279446 RepID=A0A9X3WH10_9BACI|nr:YwmB family TATA-box binding protein [Aquibacillus koreensis]MCT2535099.1 YwmB family TATA-box binding protein [Aquibacillus koreensis]MDC3419742.1 YwmB family TATA-box binding protein [Aquibacillus koreensis]
MIKPRFIFIVLVVMILVISQKTFTSASSNMLHEVDEIANLVKQENLAIGEWQVIVKEKQAIETFDQNMDYIQNKFPNATFVTKQTENATTYVWDHHKTDQVTETYTMVVANHDSPSFDISYKITGKRWNNKIKQQNAKDMETITREIFTENLTKFSCITTQSGVIMKEVSLLETLTEKLQVQTLDYLQEEDFVVLSGYTPRWQTVLPASDASMNVQLAFREGLGGKTTITIGTPIITTEY